MAARTAREEAITQPGSRAALCGHLPQRPIRVRCSLDFGDEVDPPMELRFVPIPGSYSAANSIAIR